MRAILAASVLGAASIILQSASVASYDAGTLYTGDTLHKAKNLYQCDTQTIGEWEATEPGTPVPLGGVRIYAQDGQRGRSVTYCVTDPAPSDWYCPFCQAPRAPLAGAFDILGRDLERNGESMRIVAAPGCRITVSNRPGRQKGLVIQYDNTGDVVNKHDVDIPDDMDDGFGIVYVLLECGDWRSWDSTQSPIAP